MKIIIYQNREVYKEESKIGNDSENKVETLEFEFPEEYKDFTKYIEFQTKDEKYVDLIEDDKYIITRAIAKYGKIKAQIVLRNSLENDVAVFKSDIFELKVSKSINATIDVPIEYPTWIDNLTRLKQDIEHAEHERVSNENERISAEKTRQENFTEMQKTVENATSNIKDLKEDYNENAKQKTEEFNKNFEEKQKAINDNAEAQTKTFNTNSDDKLAEYNRNHTAKMKEFDDNYDTKTKTFDDNAAAKLDEYNKNDKTKTDAYNNNASNKEETFNTNAADKQNEFDENASDKLAEYNQNAKELINKVEQVQAENEALKAENKLIKEQIPCASASGNSVHIEDSGTLDFNWKINGGHKQETREGYNLIDTSVFTDRTINGIDFKRNEDGTIKMTGTATEAFGIYLTINSFVANGDYTYFVPFNSSKGMNFSLGYNGTAIEGLNAQPQNSAGGHAHILQKTLDNQTINQLRVYIEKNTTVDYLLEWMLVKGTYTADTIPAYEQYGAMPSLGFPSEIETVGSNVNILDYNNLTDIAKTYKYLIDKEGNIYKNTATDSREWKYISSNYILTLAKGDYVLSMHFSKQTSDSNSQIAIYKEDNSVIKILKLQNQKDVKIKFSLQETEKIGLMIKSFLGVYKIKLEKGSAATPWSPYRNG